MYLRNSVLNAFCNWHFGSSYAILSKSLNVAVNIGALLSILFVSIMPRTFLAYTN